MINGGRVNLRSFDEQDVETLNRWKNDAEVLMYESTNPYLSMSKNSIRDAYLNSYETKNFAVCLKGNGELIGEVSYWYPNFFNRSTVEVGIAIWDIKYRNGYGVDAMLAIGRIIFNSAEINRVNFCISSHNYYSKRPIEKIFKNEVIIRSDRYMDGEYYDTYIFGCLRKDYVKIINMFSSKGDRLNEIRQNYNT